MEKALVPSMLAGLAILVPSLLLAQPVPSDAESPTAPAPSAVGTAEPPATDGTDAAPAPLPPDPRAAQIHALIAQDLDVAVDPQSLFDVPLDQEDELQVEATRVRALVRAVDPAAKPTDSSRALRAELAQIDEEQWSRRLELDRARLEFYALEPEARAELLRVHAERQEAARPRETEEQRRSRELERERQLALEAARAARSEAERLVSRELARLIALEERVGAVAARFAAERGELGLHEEAVLGWQRRARDAKLAGGWEPDTTYDALRRSLRAARDELAQVIRALGTEASDVPSLGADPLSNIPDDVPIQPVVDQRNSVARAITEARRDELALREARATVLLEEVDALNRERLGLLPHLSPTKRDAITGFTRAGWDQARAEARQLGLILRYHKHVTIDWLKKLRAGKSQDISAWRASLWGVPLLIATVVFFWARRRTPVLLRWADLRLAALERAAGVTSPGRRLVRLLVRIHRPLEWMLFFLVFHMLLPPTARHLLEVQLLTSAIRWALSAALTVHLINALAARDTTGLVALEEGELGALRLRSLRLVGGVMVVFALFLVLSTRLVGKGTIYSWVFSTCWFAAVPVFLLLVRWWRPVVFERLDRLRKKTPLQTWILASREGWRSFLGAMLGAVLLFTTGVVKTVQIWISGFDLVRRAHAYLFRREIARMKEDRTHFELRALPSEVLEALHPERPPTRWLPCPVDDFLKAVVERAQARRGGLMAVVGPRGMGKTSLLKEMARTVEPSRSLSCASRDFTQELGALPVEDGAAPLVLLDDAHLLVEPRIGGWVRFDETIALARSHSQTITWVLAIDASMWPLLKRARDASPVFDQVHVMAPWREEQIGALTSARCEVAGITPDYADLLDALPPGADEIDRLDALRSKQAAYERMLWDHVAGNPGLALEAWRSSLRVDQAGAVHVRPLQVPDFSKLETLPDASLFVLRAVLQLGPTDIESVVQATRLRPEEVVQDIHFGHAQGYYEDSLSSIRVAWPWLRAVTRLLQRRHLLVAS